MLLLELSAKHRMDCQHRNMAASATAKANNRDNTTADSPKCPGESPPQSREIIKPTIMELTKEVRTNILCTVEGCGKILPNTPALNMHLVKSHRIKKVFTTNPGVRAHRRRFLFNAAGRASVLFSISAAVYDDLRSYHIL
ncbi:ATM interactor-like [Stegastes partitus]|uniref:ATM interactor-like n=1 Tax=Stegastes partitus TaxID=144197 RepID=A0A9Y4KEQ0_9TELE|nr:PREDICTED: ATM interactor-like [Stegastes partitus]